MADNEHPGQHQQEGQPGLSDVTEQLLRRIAVAMEQYAQSVRQKNESGSEETKPLFVQEVGGEALEPFERSTLAIADETLRIARRTYWVALFGFFAALAAAVFVGSQVKIMSYQTQIMGTQTDSGIVGAAETEKNVRAQIATLQTQAKAAQDSVKAIQRQMRTSERAWINVQPPRVGNIVENDTVNAVVRFTNTGNTDARNLLVEVVVEKVRNGEDPANFDYSWDHAHAFSGILAKGDFYELEGRRFVKQRTKVGDATVLPTSHQEYEDFMHNKCYFRVYAKVKYQDVFGVHHWNSRCAYTAAQPPNGTSWYVTAYKCANYSDTDKN